MAPTAMLDRPPPVAGRRSTTGLPMPIIKERLEFAADRYPGWWADVRLNVRGGVMDDYRSGDSERWWRAIGVIVLDWNFCDEDGAPIALPSVMVEGVDEDGKAKMVPKTTNRDLPEDLLAALLRRFREAFSALSQPPKESSENSTTTSTTTP